MNPMIPYGQPTTFPNAGQQQPFHPRAYNVQQNLAQVPSFPAQQNLPIQTPHWNNMYAPQPSFANQFAHFTLNQMQAYHQQMAMQMPLSRGMPISSNYPMARMNRTVPVQQIKHFGRFTRVQVAALEHRFAQNQSIRLPECEQMSARIGLSTTQIRVWFQNARVRDRQQKKLESLKSLSESQKTPMDQNVETTEPNDKLDLGMKCEMDELSKIMDVSEKIVMKQRVKSEDVLDLGIEWDEVEKMMADNEEADETVESTFSA